MSHFDALMYAAGLLAFWLGLIVFAVALFRGADVDCDTCGACCGCDCDEESDPC